MNFDETEAWGESFRLTGAGEGEVRVAAALETALRGLRENAALLADEIRRDLPGFTAHDVTHFDRLWELVDTIRGEGQSLNPAEGFVLGAAILIHDLGMAVAAYPGGRVGLRVGVPWEDALRGVLVRALGRQPSADELANVDDAALEQATAELLRERHADRAEQLCDAYWEDDDGNRYHLLENIELRQVFGRVVGLIAASHGKPVAELRQYLPGMLGAAPGHSSSWTVDPLKLACLLRAADACHLDRGRAPVFLAAIRELSPVSREHWRFHAKLNQPRAVGDRVVFTGNAPFGRDEASAWWLCFSTLQIVDRELREIDSLLADIDQPRLAVTNVAGAEDPGRLVACVATDGWLPVDARMHVSDLPRVVDALGGEALYGPDLAAPLRELIQNGADAVRARRLKEGRASDWGMLTVRLDEADGRWFLEVVDEGLGMSPDALSNGLLDFGASYWSSEQARREHPGLLSAGFEPTGRYGIGFFSVFMLGKSVEVCSRRHDASYDDTHVLSFSEGVQGRPLLRKAEPDERLMEGGTRVRVWLDRDPYGNDGLLDGVRAPLAGYVAFLAPASDVTVEVDAAGSVEVAVAAGDWLDLDGHELVKRIAGDVEREVAYDRDSEDNLALVKRALASNMRIIEGAAGDVVGRACVVPVTYISDSVLDQQVVASGMLAIGGLRSCEVVGVAGILLGRPLRASRDSGLPTVGRNELAAWATEQAGLLAADASPAQLYKLAGTIYACGGSVLDLPVARLDGEWLSLREVREMESPPRRVVLTDYLYVETAEEDEREGPVTAAPDVWYTEPYTGDLITVTEWPDPAAKLNGPLAEHVNSGSLLEATLTGLMHAWGATESDLRLAVDEQFTIASTPTRRIVDEAVIVEYDG